MFLNKKINTSATTLLISFLCAASLSGAGFRLPNQNAEITARGNTGFASVDDASAVYYNPARLTSLSEAEIQLGMSAVIFDVDAEFASSTATSDNDVEFIPNFFYAKPYEGYVFGIGAFAPFGLSNSFDPTVQFSPLGIEASIKTIRVPLVVSKQLNEYISVGGGLTITKTELNYTLAELDGSVSDLKGSNSDLGYVLALNWKPAEGHSLGLVYNSKTKHTLEGRNINTSLGRNELSADFTLPEYIDLGYAYQPNDSWLFEIGIEWINWESLDTVVVNQTGPSGPKFLPFNWDATFIYQIGASYHWDNYTFSLGYNYNENAVPDEFFNPLVADANRHFINFGASADYDLFTVQLSYQYGFSDRDVEGSTFGLTDGNWETDYQSFMVSINYQF